MGEECEYVIRRMDCFGRRPRVEVKAQGLEGRWAVSIAQRGACVVRRGWRRRGRPIMESPGSSVGRGPLSLQLWGAVGRL